MIKPQAAIAELRECVEKHCADCEATIAPLREERDEARRRGEEWAEQAQRDSALAVANERLKNDNASLRERVRVLEGALRELSTQRMTNEMDEEDKEGADFEGAYDIIIGRARAALNEQLSRETQK